jgi:hypothetical protein
MSDILKLLNDNAGALNALFTAVVALATVVYAVLTSRLVRETRHLRQVQTEPHVEIYCRMRDEWMSLIDIVIKNIGLGPAYELRFEVSATADSEGTKALLNQLKEFKFITSGITFLAPGQEVSSFWTNMTEQFDKKIDARLVFRSSCRSATGQNYDRAHTIDLSELKGIHRIGEPPLLKIAKLIENLQRDIGHLVSGFKKLKVDMYDTDDRALEGKHWEEERAKRAAQAKPE